MFRQAEHTAFDHGELCIFEFECQGAYALALVVLLIVPCQVREMGAADVEATKGRTENLRRLHQKRPCLPLVAVVTLG